MLLYSRIGSLRDTFISEKGSRNKGVDRRSLLNNGGSFLITKKGPRYDRRVSTSTRSARMNENRERVSSSNLKRDYWLPRFLSHKRARSSPAVLDSSLFLFPFIYIYIFFSFSRIACTRVAQVHANGRVCRLQFNNRASV